MASSLLGGVGVKEGSRFVAEARLRSTLSKSGGFEACNGTDSLLSIYFVSGQGYTMNVGFTKSNNDDGRRCHYSAAFNISNQLC